MQDRPLTGLKVLVVGAGGAGTYSAIALRCAGAHVVAIDDDRLEARNASRIPWAENEGGKSKVHALAERVPVVGLEGRYPSCRPKGFNYVVDATDDGPGRRLIYQAATEDGAVYVRAGYDARADGTRREFTVMVGVPVFGEAEPGYTAPVDVVPAMLVGALVVEAIRLHRARGEPVVLEGTVERLAKLISPRKGGKQQ